MLAYRAELAFKHFNNMTISLAFQGAHIIAFRIISAAKKGAMLPGTNN
jgi:hypothetical protein